MLPLDKLSEQAEKILCDNGYEAGEIFVSLELDMSASGEFAKDYLCISGDKKLLLYVDEKEKKVTSYDISRIAELYIDNYTTTNRLLCVYGQTDAPRKKQCEDEGKDFKAEYKEYVNDCSTVTCAQCTNAKKRKLLAFCSIFDKTANGDEVKDDDGIFEQFNAKCPKCGKRYEDQQRKICKDCTNKKGTFARLMGYYLSYKTAFIVSILALFGISLTELAIPAINGKLLFDQVISQPGVNAAGEKLGQLHEVKYVFFAVGLIVLAEVLIQLFIVIFDRTIDRLSARVTEKMKNEVFDAMCHQSLSYFNKHPTGKLMTRVNYDADKIRGFFTSGIPHFILNVTKFVGIAILLFSMNPSLTLVVFIPVPIIVAIFKFMLPKLWRSFSKQWRRSSALNGMLGDSLNGIRVIKAFSKEVEETNRFRGYSTKLLEANLKTNLISICIFPVVSLLIGLSSQAIWGFGGIQVMKGYMTYGELTTYLGYIGMIFAPLEFFTVFTNIITDVLNAADRMFETKDAIPDIANSSEPLFPEDIKGDIEFKNVSFHYSANRPILKDISFHITPGEHVGIVGHTGSGKSTVANLITRMYDVISGTVTIDGVNVKDIDLSTLRKNVAIVSQEIYLFDASIADNIRYARPDATLAEIVAAAKAANAHDFIMNLPEGYETVVGGGSRSLSGGEKQRISIARALLLSPKILILDEATAAMDTKTERLISRAIDELIVGKTTITIAHRLSTLKNCTRIMAIEHGEIAECGTPSELLEKKGVYYKLYTLQEQQLQKVIHGN